MDVNSITQLIGGVGFPIVACIAMFWDNRQARKEHKEEVEKLTEVIERNTIAITKLVEKEDK